MDRTRRVKLAISSHCERSKLVMQFLYPKSSINAVLRFRGKESTTSVTEFLRPNRSEGQDDLDAVLEHPSGQSYVAEYSRV